MSDFLIPPPSYSMLCPFRDSAVMLLFEEETLIPPLFLIITCFETSFYLIEI